MKKLGLVLGGGGGLGSYQIGVWKALREYEVDKMIKALIKEANNGNTKAFEILRDTVGEKPIDRQEVKEITSEWFK